MLQCGNYFLQKLFNLNQLYAESTYEKSQCRATQNWFYTFEKQK
uniref:Uncharacterized protein n=1 Tax=Rhizophora mucronata TaxID=61149 RepID=A0A2P2QQW1_RHIMU